MSAAWGGQPPNLTSGAHWGAPGIGILGSAMKASWDTGEHGASPLANDALVDTKEYRWFVVTQPTPGVVTGTEVGRVTVDVPNDGTFVWTYQLVEDGVSLGVATATTVVGIPGNATITVSVTGTSSLTFAATGAVTANIASQENLWPASHTVKVGPVGVRAISVLLDYQEVANIGMDFSAELLPSEAIVSATAAVILLAGVDTTPNTVLDASPHVDVDQVVQRVRGKTPNSTYTIRCIAVLNSGRQIVGSVLISFGIK